MHIGPLTLPEIIIILLVCAVIFGIPILIAYIIIKMVKHVK